jgi:tetratricopeptide (TPR) repeat protein
MLDDRNHIVKRPNLHLSELTLNNITNTFFRSNEQGKQLYRPISCLTLALNYYIGKYTVTGYHIVNLIIHLITSFFLFKTMVILLSQKKFNLNYTEIKNIAGLATILWAAHPIQTQAITYIVQRMASLSAMFYIIGLWCYIKSRSNINIENSMNKKKWLFFSFFFFLCAVFSKENAALFPLGILFIELFFFDGYERIKVNPVKSICIGSIILLIPVLFFFHTTNFEEILSAYDHRPFTLIQRLLTEPRILLFHVSQLLYPIPGRFSILHSVVLSDSLFGPFSTFLAITVIFIILIFALVTSKKYPLIGFPVVFYFAHHLVESTFIALELIFEHRNYLPSLFFFLPVAYGIMKLLSIYKKQNKFIYFLIIAFSTSIIFLIGLSTHIRNKDWQTHESLWESAAKNAPDQIRPYAQLGWYHTSENRINIQKAEFYFRQGLNKKESYNVFEKALLWINIAKTYNYKNNTFDTINALIESKKIIEKQINNVPDLINESKTIELLTNTYYYLANNYFYVNDMENAFYYIDMALDLKKDPAFLNAKAGYLIKEKKYSLANKILQQSLKKDYDNFETFSLLGNTLTGMGNLRQGQWFHKQAQIKKRKWKDK